MGNPTVIDTPAAMRSWSATASRRGHTIALVPTMGALHDGHLTLIDAARERADLVVVSIFVNPLQFGEQSDFDRYPRPIDDDLDACAQRGVDAIFAPTAAAMYPLGFDTLVSVGRLAEPMEGAARPGHFDGVVTVVTKLLTAVRPDHAMFGEKDFQQLAIVRRLSTDLNLGVEIVGCPTVREADGLAMSSRNRRLDAVERRAASCVPRAIAAAVRTAADPDATVADVLASAHAVVADEPLAELDYVEVFEPDTLVRVDELATHHRRPDACRIAIAVRVGAVRLIDNAHLFPA